MVKTMDMSYVEFNRHIFKKLTMEEMEWIVQHCDEKLEKYYKKGI